MRNQVLGFSRQQQAEGEYAEDIVRDRTAAEILVQEGLQQALKLVKEYVSGSYLPLVKGQARDQMYMEKMRKVKERYFDSI